MHLTQGRGERARGCHVRNDKVECINILADDRFDYKFYGMCLVAWKCHKNHKQQIASNNKCSSKMIATGNSNNNNNNKMCAKSENE